MMGAVVQAVKSAYVASTKYRQASGKYVSLGTNITYHIVVQWLMLEHVQGIVTWKMKAPEKKPLVTRQNPDEFRSKVIKSMRVKKEEPIKSLSQFQSASDSFA